MNKILFICTGNTCRSPMAEYLLKDIIKTENLNWEVLSAGLHVFPGSQGNEKMIKVLKEEGINVRSHRAQQLTVELLSEVDLVLTMTESHKEQILKMRPEITENNIVFTLKEFVGEKDYNIGDPYGSSLSNYRKTRENIKKNLKKLFKILSFNEGDLDKISNIKKEGSFYKMSIIIGSDHAGFQLKEEIKKFLKKKEIDFQDMGAYSEESVDYPDIAVKVAKTVADDPQARGILICGTGIGMSIAANKVKGIRAAHCQDVYSARLTRLHNNSNIMTMGERVVGKGLALEIVQAWLGTDFEGGRHGTRVDKIMGIEEGNC